MNKMIRILKAANGYLIEITTEGNQTISDKTEVHVAKNDKEVLKIVKENL